MIFMTGSSGYVGSAFSPLIKKTDELIGIDPSACMLGIRSSLMAIKKGKY